MKNYVSLDDKGKPDYSMLPTSVIDDLLPWSPKIPEMCHKQRC